MLHFLPIFEPHRKMVSGTLYAFSWGKKGVRHAFETFSYFFLAQTILLINIFPADQPEKTTHYFTNPSHRFIHSIYRISTLFLLPIVAVSLKFVNFF